MPLRLLIALVLLVAAPLVLLGWVSSSAVRQQQDDARDQLIGFFEARLIEIDHDLSEVFRRYERQLQQTLDSDGYNPQALSRIDRTLPMVRAAMYVDRRGTLVYPSRPWPEDSQQVALYASLPALISSRPKLRRDDSSSLQRGAKGFDRPSVAPTAVWQAWYLDEGLQLICWFPVADGAAVGMLLERARWMSDLTAALPDVPANTSLDASVLDAPVFDLPSTKKTVSSGRTSRTRGSTSTGATALTDEIQRVIYRWGNDAVELDEPLAMHSLSSPLSSWRLEYYTRDPLTASTTTPLILSLAGLGILLLSLGGYVVTSVQRQMRVARGRVSFASQVSHELRTPLTNIRLYAELAEDDLTKLSTEDLDHVRQSLHKRLQVINTESHRLSRLVSGVLELIRDPQKRRQPKLQPAVPDELIRQVLLQFEPSFERIGIHVSEDLQADREVMLDPDIVELVLVNLLSNVEKYAADGKRVRVASREHEADAHRELIIEVSDAGPGIPKRLRESIFRPFWRGDDSVDAPSGTGIGLTIGRRLAQRHGGSLQLINSNDTAEGACFQLRISTQN